MRSKNQKNGNAKKITYSKVDLCKAANRSNNSIYYWIKLNRWPDKKEYTESEKDKFVKLINETIISQSLNEKKMQPSETDKKYNKSQFSRAIGFSSDSAIYNYINSGRIENKKFYTQKDLDDFKKGINQKVGTNIQATQGPIQSQSGLIYTKAEIGGLFGKSIIYAHDLIKRGLLPKQKTYTENDINILKNTLANLEAEKPNKKQIATPISPFIQEPESPAFDPDFNPFEIIEEKDKEAENKAWANKLIIHMKNLQAKSLQVVPVPGHLFGTQARTIAIINLAKKLIQLENGYEESVFETKSHKNVNGEYTHSTIKRIN